MKFEIEGTDMRKKRVNSARTTGRVYVPKEWIGKDVVVILIE